MRPSQEYRNGYELVLVNLIRERLADWQRPAIRGDADDAGPAALVAARGQAAAALLCPDRGGGDGDLSRRGPRRLPQGIASLVTSRVTTQGKGVAAFRGTPARWPPAAGKTTVMAMIAAWSILNKVNARATTVSRDMVLVVCPNVTIRSRWKS